MRVLVVFFLLVLTLARYGSLMWSLGKVFKTPEVVKVYVGSFWDKPYTNTEFAKLFDAERDDLLRVSCLLSQPLYNNRSFTCYQGSLQLGKLTSL